MLNKRGFTLIEVLLVMAVLGLLAIALMKSGVGFLSGSKVGVATDQVRKIYQAVESLRITRGCDSYSGCNITVTDLVNRKLLQDTKTPFGTNFTFGSVGSSGYCMNVTYPVGDANLASDLAVKINNLSSDNVKAAVSGTDVTVVLWAGSRPASLVTSANCL